MHNINTCHAHCTVGCNFEDLEAILKPRWFHHPIIAHVNMALNSESDVFCKHSECVNAQDNKNIGHCLICHAAFHFSCTGVKNKATFVCSPCSGAVKSAQTIQDSVLALNKTLLENVKLITKLQNDLAVKHQECLTLKDEISSLKQQGKSIPSPCACRTKNRDEHSTVVKTKGHLVMADFTLKDLDPQQAY